MASDFVASRTQPVSNTTLARRQNALALFQDYAEKALASGVSPKGLEQSFAATRQIESACGKPSLWLDEARKNATPSTAEAAFLELALNAWRATNNAGRKALRDQLKAMLANRVDQPGKASRE